MFNLNFMIQKLSINSGVGCEPTGLIGSILGTVVGGAVAGVAGPGAGAAAGGLVGNLTKDWDIGKSSGSGGTKPSITPTPPPVTPVPTDGKKPYMGTSTEFSTLSAGQQASFGGSATANTGSVGGVLNSISSALSGGTPASNSLLHGALWVVGGLTGVTCLVLVIRKMVKHH